MKTGMPNQETVSLCFLLLPLSPGLSLPFSPEAEDKGSPQLTGCSFCAPHKSGLVAPFTLQSFFLGHELWLLPSAKAQEEEGEPDIRCPSDMQRSAEDTIAFEM